MKIIFLLFSFLIGISDSLLNPPRIRPGFFSDSAPKVDLAPLIRDAQNSTGNSTTKSTTNSTTRSTTNSTTSSTQNSSTTTSPKSQNPIVRISSGQLQGKLVNTNNSNSAYVFLGIPYGETPIGELRFADPIKRIPWSGTLNATEYSKICPQNASIAVFHDASEMDEDCLTLNVFAPIDAIESQKQYPVLYYIHGGAWDFDSPRMFAPEVLIDNFVSIGLVMVTVQYRMGALGFWTTGDSMGGNWGVKDIVLGMQWVKDEIRTFGGYPDQVTIMGHSSSAFGVSLLSMTPKTKGLFQRAAILSGPGPSPGSTNQDLTRFRDVAIKLGCATRFDFFLGRTNKITECMRKVDAQLLTNVYMEPGSVENPNMGEASAPQSTSPRIDGPNGLFPAPVDVMIKTRQSVPTLTGSTINELSFAKFMYLNATPQDVADMCDTVGGTEDKNQQRAISSACKSRYISPYLSKHNFTDSNFWRNQTVQVTEDSGFYAPSFTEVDSVRAQGAPVWLYSFDYVKRGLEGIAPWHAMDMTYVFAIHMFPFDDSDRTIASFYPTYFANFAKFGHPTPFPIRGAVWDPVDSPVGFNYLSIDVNPEMKPFYHYDAVEFWNSIVPAIKNNPQYSPYGQGGGFPFPFGDRNGRGNGPFDRQMAQQVQNGVVQSNDKSSLVGVIVGGVVAVAVVAGVIGIVITRHYKGKRRSYRSMMKSAGGKNRKNTEYELLCDNDDTLYYKSF